MLLIGDVAYEAIRWRGLSDTFDPGFLLGFGVLVAMGLFAKAFGLGEPIGGDRQRARLRARSANLVAVGRHRLRHRCIQLVRRSAHEEKRTRRCHTRRTSN